MLIELQCGVGREMKMRVETEQFETVATRLWELVSDGDVDGVADSLLGIEASFSAQNRRIAAAKVGVGASYGGYGGELEGSASWLDRRSLEEQIVSAGSAIDELFGPAELTALLDRLAAEVEDAR